MPERHSHPVTRTRTTIAIVLASILALVGVSALAQAPSAAAREGGDATAKKQRSGSVSERRKPRRNRYRSRRSRGERKPAPAPAPTEEPAPAPSPAPAPAPAPTPSSDIIFQANKLKDFWLVQSGPGAVSEVADPAGSGQKVFKMVVEDDDAFPVTPTENPRAEMLSPSTIEAGQEFWFSSKFFLPADFPASVPGWMNVMQGPYGYPWNGPPPWHVEVNGSNLRWTRNSTYGWDVPWQMPLARNQWVNVMVHERFGEDGWIEMWIDGRQITFFGGGTYNPNHVAPAQRLSMKTMDRSNNQGTNSVYLQSYRKIGMFGSLTSYAGPLTIGKTRASVGG
jgi:hypothetical protein